jgi:hypothetical protein
VEPKWTKVHGKDPVSMNEQSAAERIDAVKGALPIAKANGMLPKNGSMSDESPGA